MKIKYICIQCGSDHVSRDASCRWNIETQQWEIANFTNFTFCHDCNDNLIILELPIEEGEDQ